jgi:hypothetical protein
MTTAVTVNSSQESVLVSASYPAIIIKESQDQILASVSGPEYVEASQLSVLVSAMGSTVDPAVRAWTFTLDNHDYYVLRLGTQETLVYDDHAKQWYTWSSGDGNTWKAYNGCNWYGGQGWSYTNGSNIIVGDDGNGSLYFLDPFQDTDDDAVYGPALPVPFRRETYGQLPFRGYNHMPCFGVQIQGSIGDQTNTAINSVDLLTSDDRGGTYQDAGEIQITPGAIDTRLYWRSLGSMRAPGRIFKVVDYGALKRLDSMEMLDGKSS